MLVTVKNEPTKPAAWAMIIETMACNIFISNLILRRGFCLPVPADEHADARTYDK